MQRNLLENQAVMSNKKKNSHPQLERTEQVHKVSQEKYFSSY